MPRADDFTVRHIGSNPEQLASMLEALGVESLDELIEQTVPASIRSQHRFKLPEALDENRLNKLSRLVAADNRAAISMLGLGYYGTVTPPVIRRNVLENPDWYTAYTPYQPEVSQARLEVLLSFQQMIIDLTGLQIANASLLDESTAAAEAMMLARRVNKNKSKRFLLSADCLPQTIAVVQTRARPFGIDAVVVDFDAFDVGDGGDGDGDGDNNPGDNNPGNPGDCFGALLQYPGASGRVRDHRALIDALHKRGALAVMAADPLALTLLTPPGELGADIAVGSAQRFGVPMGFGGPHAAYIATREVYKRSIPGRLIGVSIDANGERAYRMALQTREQHIRRDKATSNICTAQVLLAIMATFYAQYHGPEGLTRIARRINRLTRALAEQLAQLGFDIVHRNFFDTLTVHTPGRARRLLDAAEQAGYNLRFIDADHLGISLDETISPEKVEGLLHVFAGATAGAVSGAWFNRDLAASIPAALQRAGKFLEHPHFHRYRSETEFMRYLRRTASKDITLSRSMIPLGSCTMKLNAASEMEPISNPLFAHIHPFAPQQHARGYHRIIDKLDAMLCELTGFAAFSFQPNAGSQGEYAGLLCIRAWHGSRGDNGRDVCLIPQSAHGTNPASAVMAGMQVVVVKCDANGNIDLDDFQAKAERHSAKLAAAMITYPSTHGVFEEGIGRICELVHDNGGQVYLDGANMNAMVGICRPAEIGADVMHLNLHKTFAIPHGGGGPGMGPIGVARHLAPFLPDHPVVSCNRNGGGGVREQHGGGDGGDGDHGRDQNDPGDSLGTVSGAPFGSPLVLPISWAYMRLLGLYGLRRATQVAILNANYIAHRLDPHYPVVYRGAGGRVAHECVISLAAFKESCGVTVEDVAKRLIDYGYHAPTMSWPVPDSLMIEPTESESKQEIDRFCDALISIRAEIREIEAGKFALDDNLLVNAPHSYHLLVGDDWRFPYPRRRAFFPTADARANKYWPPVGRVDNVYGDKNLVCTCPPLSDYADDDDG
ncbi:MAG: aminomethyl-transferring glycine dehydrogenase [Gammaproteobacteria bacterium]|nr:aminomethyl-transferring glycine dehydrogenase [Gammaproteobacteria bacterium]